MHYIGIQGSYSGVEVAYFNDETLKANVALKGTKASSHLIPLLQQLFQDYHLSLQDLDFIAVDKGPGAFTSLRVTIATLNGIGYATHMPLVGVNGLQALYQEVWESIQQKKVDGVICLLNAYSNDAYFLVKSNSFEEEGCARIDQVLSNIGPRFADKRLMFVGNGVALHVDAITRMCKEFNIVQENSDKDLLTCSALYIAKLGLQTWQQNSTHSYTIVPHYLKEQAFAIHKT